MKTIPKKFRKENLRLAFDKALGKIDKGNSIAFIEAGKINVTAGTLKVAVQVTFSPKPSRRG